MEAHVSKLVYNINELAPILGFTVPAVHAHLARNNYDAVPPPVYLGRRLAWPVESVNQWLDAKLQAATTRSLAQSDQPRPGVGRPRNRHG